MLNKYAYRNIEIIRETAKGVWDGNCIFGELKEIDSPYPEFEWFLHIYGRFDVRLNYDRSILVIEVPTEEGYTELSGLVGENVFWGFEGMEPQNLLHNFQVLDRLLLKNIN